MGGGNLVTRIVHRNIRWGILAALYIIHSVSANHHLVLDEDCLVDRMVAYEERIEEAGEAVSYDRIISGKILHTHGHDSYTVRTHWRDISGDMYVKEYTLDGNMKVVSTTEEPHNVLEAFGMSGSGLHVMADPELGEIYIHISNKTVNCSYVVNISPYHGEILTSPNLRTFALSPNDDKLLYLAEGFAPPKYENEDEHFDSEQIDLEGAVNPKIVEVDVYNQEVKTLSLPAYILPGKSMWTPDGNGIVTLTRSRKKYLCPECTDVPTRLAYIDLTEPSPQLRYLTPEGIHVSIPKFIGDRMYYFSNSLHYKGNEVTEHESQALESIPFPFPFPINIEPTVIVESSYTMDAVGYYGLYPNRIDPWTPGGLLEDGKLLSINSLTWGGHQPVLINLETGQIELIQREGMVKILDVMHGKILGLSERLRGYELLIGELEEIATPTVDPLLTENNSTTYTDPCQEFLDSLLNSHHTTPTTTTTHSTTHPATTMESTTASTTSTTPEPATTTPSTTLATTTQSPDMSVIIRKGKWHPIIDHPSGLDDVDIHEKDHGGHFKLRSGVDRLHVMLVGQYHLTYEHKVMIIQFWLHLGWDVLVVDDVGAYDGNILANPVNVTHHFIQSVAQDYTSTLLSGVELDGTLAIMLAEFYPDHYDQVMAGDPVTLLATLLLYRKHDYYRMLQIHYPNKPSPNQIHLLWKHSPISRTNTYSASTLIFDSGKFPRQSQRFRDRIISNRDVFIEVKKSSGESFAKYLMYGAKVFQYLGGYEEPNCMKPPIDESEHTDEPTSSSHSTETEPGNGAITSTNSMSSTATEEGSGHMSQKPEPTETTHNNNNNNNNNHSGGGGGATATTPTTASSGHYHSFSSWLVGMVLLLSFLS